MNFPRPRSCPHKGVVERDGDWFCRMHDPERVAKKQEERAAKQESAYQQRRDAHARVVALQTSFLGIKDVGHEIKALKECIRVLRCQAVLEGPNGMSFKALSQLKGKWQ